VDRDGHIWVADASQDRVQVFDQEGHLLAYFGESGKYPGQFSLPTGLCIDKLNRVIVSEQMFGRIQVFRYIPEAEAAAEKAQRDKRASVSEKTTAGQPEEIKR
jgi:sugar lactone lactonase YvrE